MGCQSKEKANRVHRIRRMENGKGGALDIFLSLSLSLCVSVSYRQHGVGCSVVK